MQYTKVLAALFFVGGCLHSGAEKWSISFDEAQKRYVGKKLRFPQESRTFQFTTIYVGIARNGAIQGSSLNYHGDGKFLPLTDVEARKYFALFVRSALKSNL